MSSRIPEVSISYETISECQAMHGNMLKCGRGTDIQKVLREHYPYESVFRPDWLNTSYISSEDLLNRILCEKKKEVEEVEELDASFVVIKAGAFEAANDQSSNVTGFCLQRLESSLEDLGEPAVKMIAQSLKNENSVLDPRSYMQKRCQAGPVTALRKRFHKDTCISVKNLRWLVKHRNLQGVEILHFIFYSHKKYLTPFIQSLLQDRHNLVRAGKKNSLDACLFKILSNSIYGQVSSRSSRFIYVLIFVRFSYD